MTSYGNHDSYMQGKLDMWNHEGLMQCSSFPLPVSIGANSPRRLPKRTGAIPHRLWTTVDP